MARERDPTQPVDFAEQLLGGEPNVAEVETREDVLVDAVDEHVTVVGLDLGRVQDEEAIAVFERPVLPPQVELPVLRQHDAVERSFVAFAGEELQVRLDRCAAVVRKLGVEVEIEDHRPGEPRLQAGRNFGKVTSGVTSSKSTSTGMPMRTASGAQSTTFVMSRTPSASSTTAST